MKLFTTCVGYDDFLSATVPKWTDYGEVHVITRPGDEKTADVCCELQVPCHFSDGWWSNRSTINKGAALHDIVHRIAQPHEPVVLFDADCYPVGNLEAVELFPDVMWGCQRFLVPDDATLQRQLLMTSPLTGLRRISNGSYRAHLVRGFFQHFLYHRRLQFTHSRYRTFGGCDLGLAAQFTRNFWLDPSQFYVLHLGTPGKNWKGRVTTVWV